jgi:PKD repeat protein
LQPFIAWKIKKGFKVEIGYTDVIGSTTTAVKNWLEGLYNAGTAQDPAPSFVLFVGDVQQIPSNNGSAGEHITDMRYCEFTGDYFPEMYYGRFSAQNTLELQPQIDKTLEYEQFTMPDPSYLGEVTLVAGVDVDLATMYFNGYLNYGANYYFNAAHGISPHVWLYPDSEQPGAPAAITQTVSDGVGLYNYVGHCGHYGPDNPNFNPNDIANLTNIHKYLLGIGNCCQSNTFGSNFSTPCFGEEWLQAENKGGIGWIGGTNDLYVVEDHWWAMGFYSPIKPSGPTYEESSLGAYDGIFHDHGEPVSQHYTTNGGIIFAGNMAVTASGSGLTEYCWEVYHLMGDPSVMTYMGVPSANTIFHTNSVTSTATSISVQADPGSYVGISRGGVLHGAGYINDTGSAGITLTPFGTLGAADIVVTCQNRVPYTSTLTITGPSDPPIAEFVASPTSGMPALTIDFTDQSIGETSWSWDFGDTGTSTEQHPTHTYTSVGTYTVSLTVTNANGSGTETKTNYITVIPLEPPVADFTAAATTIETGQSVTFSDSSANNPTSWTWTFDGGTPATSTNQDPTVTYNTAGTYTVSLTATNAEGGDTETKTGYITVTDPAPVYCESWGYEYRSEWIGRVEVGPLDNPSGQEGYGDFTSIITDLVAGETVNVTLTAEMSGAPNPEYWKIWIDYNIDGDFEDPGEDVFSAVGTSVATGGFTVPAAAAGVTRMRVSLKWDSEPTPCEYFDQGEVEDYTVDIGDGTIDPPVADFSANTTTVQLGGSVNFSDLSSENPTSWSWAFEGGTPAASTAQNPAVTYNTPGTYEVTLTSTNSAGSDSEIKAGYITVLPLQPPVAEFFGGRTTVEEGQTVDFADLSSNNPTSWSWTFEGGTPAASTEKNPFVVYNTVGTYTVTLTATNSAGSDTEIKTGYITVNPGVLPLVFETGVLTGVGSNWQTVTLQNTYTSMVVVCSNDLGSTGLPAVCRVKFASGNSFDVSVQNPGGAALSGYNVHYLVVEEGVYNVAEHGVKMEAKKADSTTTARAGSWGIEQRTYGNSYTNPVVLGQVMTGNNQDWSVFWASSSNKRNPPSATALYAGKHIGEDPNLWRLDETIGYIVIEQGEGTMNGIPYAAAVGPDIVKGPGNTNKGYTYTFNSVPNAYTAIISAAAMDDGNGGWPVFYGSTPLTSTSLTLVFDEDQLKDSERRHSTEQVAYIVFGQ